MAYQSTREERSFYKSEEKASAKGAKKAERHQYGVIFYSVRHATDLVVKPIDQTVNTIDM